MPLTSLHLVSLAPSASISAFIPLLASALPAAQQPLLIARPLRWMIEPWISSPSAADQAALDALTSSSWDLLLVFPAAVDALPAQPAAHVRRSYVLAVGISSKLLAGFHEANSALLHPPPGAVPPLTGALDKPLHAVSSRDLQLTPDLQAWFASPAAPRSAPSMLNFLSIRPGKLDSYKAYGQAFAADVGRRRGGLAKIVGSVVEPQRGGEEKQQVWDEIALAHYPSVWHFADMAASDDYQAVNQRHRVGALRGTAILCCDELDAEVLKGLEAAKGAKAKI